MNFTMNKIFGGVLTAAIVAFAAMEVSHLLVHPVELAEPAYKVEVPEEGGAAAVEEEVIPLSALLAAANIDKGARVAKKCAGCHTFEEGGKNGTGPNLYGVLGKNIGSTAGYSYSSAMAGKSGEAWSFDSLDGFLTNPKGWLDGTKMNYKGISKPEQRADLLLYLNSLSAAPLALPTE